MSLAEAAAALDRLLWGHSQEALPGGAGPNVPPYAPPPLAQENLLPALLPRTYTPQTQGPLSSTPVASPDDAPPSAAQLPWEALTRPAAAEDLLFPVSPLQAPATPAPPPPPSDRWLALSDLPRHSRSCRRTLEDQRPSRSNSSSNSRRRRSSSSSSRQGPGEDDEDDDDDDDSPTTPTGSFTPLDPEKYKTELCRSYQVHGFCRYGARCNYAHGLRQLRGASHHGKYKTRNCQSYHQTGFCRYGARCSFIHDPEEGVLKCSIANKEVLEALYYFPTCEEASRTASITWRLQEAGSPHTQELHLIANSRPLEEDPGHVASPRSSPRGSPYLDAENFLLGGSRLWAYNPPSPARDDGSCAVRHDGKDSVPPLGSQGRDVTCGVSLQLTHPSGGVGQRRPRWDASPEGKERHVAEMNPFSRQLQQKVSGASARASLFPMKSRRRLSWMDVAPADLDPLGGKGEAGSLISECQDLQKLDVVHSILQKAPQYSAMVWSDGTDGGPAPDPIPSILPKDLVPYCREDDKNGKAGDDDDDDKDKDVRKDNTNKPRSKDDDDDDDPPSRSRRSTMPTDEDDVVFSSTLQSESEDDGKAVQGADGADGDDWSASRSLHLADLFRCLRVREHQMPPEDTSLPSLTSLPLPVRRRSHDLTKYKTELCRSFQYNGYCEYGEACLYAHGPLDLRCYPRHPMYRTKQCFSFHNKGFCLYGSRCQFLHDLE